MGPRQEDPSGQRTQDDTLKYSSLLQSEGFFSPRSRQPGDPFPSFLSLIAPHPEGHFSQFLLGWFSCGWYHALGQFVQLFAPFNEAYFPLAQFMHETEPRKLVFPAGQESHAVLSTLPFVPGGHAFVSLQMPLSKLHLLADQPGAFF